MSEKSNVENKKEKEDEITLASFIEENHKLITVLGVLTALTVFALSFDLEGIGQLLSLLFLTMAMLVWIELWRKFPFSNEQWNLYWFRTLATMSIFVLFIYWFYAISEVREFLTLVLWFVILFPISWVMRRINFPFRYLNIKQGKKTGFRYWVAFILLGIIVISTLLLSNHIAQPIYDFFEGWRNVTPTTTP